MLFRSGILLFGWRVVHAVFVIEALPVQFMVGAVDVRQLKSEIEPVDGKLAVSEILTAIMTSSEIEASQTWEEAETAIQSLNLFDTPPEMDLFRLVYAQLRTTFLEVDVGFIHELGYLYLNVLSMAVIRNLRQH